MEIYKIFNNITSEITTLRQAIFVKEQGIPYKLEIEADEDKFLHFCLFIDQQLIAYARVSIKGAVVHIGRVCVQRNYRKLGYGRKIMEYIEAQDFSTMVQEYQLNAQITARDFYIKLGYQVIGQEFMEAGILHYPMHKTRKMDKR